MSELTIRDVVREAGAATAAAISARLQVRSEAVVEQPVTEVVVEAAPEVVAEVPAAEATVAEPVTDAAPADEAKGMTFKAVCVDDQGVIIGIGASIATDNESETVNKAALIGMAYDFCSSDSRAFHANHDKGTAIGADLVASWPGAPVLKSGRLLAPGESVPKDDAVIAINIEKGKETHWFIGVKPHDPQVLEQARKGELVGFSWGGYARKVTA